MFDAGDPPPGMLDWFDRAAEGIEVLPIDGEHEKHSIWISNAAPGHSWAGTEVAVCRSRDDALLLAYALKQLRDVRRPGMGGTSQPLLEEPVGRPGEPGARPPRRDWES